MPRRRLLWQIYPTYLVITLICVVAVGLYAIGSLRSFSVEQASADLEGQTRLIADQIRQYLVQHDQHSLDSLCRRYRELSPDRLTILSKDGSILADSHLADSQRSNQYARPEIHDALNGGLGRAFEAGTDELAHSIAVAVTITDSTEILGLIRLSIPTTMIRARMSQMYVQLLIGGFIILAVLGWATLLVARRISHPIELIKQGAERYAAGDLDSRLPVPDSEEIGSLAELMNTMSAQLSDRIRLVTAQRNEQEAILASMVEGVVAVDRDDRILTINQAAGRIFALSPAEAIGRPIQEVIRISQLAILAERSREQGKPVEEELHVTGKGSEYFLQAHANVLRDGNGTIIGTAIILNDLTRIRQLENIRKEFVANVSHELRTPLTLVKGYVETLLEGGLDEKADAQRFVMIISRHVDRLNNIIEDLLSLSRIEQQAEGQEIVMSRGSVAEVVDQVVELQRSAAMARSINMEVHCPRNLMARFSHSLLEQALSNLVDNAIKYSPDGSTISISAEPSGGMVAIHVADNGPGIATEHHSRIFERFYRIDKGRSRERGGTGLGLSIVKHIVIAMGGQVALDSAPGKGSRFTIYLPATTQSFDSENFA